MTRQLTLLIVVISVSIFGCKRQKLQRVVQPSLNSTSSNFRSIDTVPDSLNVPVDFTYLTTKSKITVKSRQQNIDNATVAFRMKKDSAIWMSASVLGLEVMRAIISTEGIRIMDRINKVYSDAPYRVLAQKLGFPLDYTLLQSFFLADIPYYSGQKLEIQEDPDQTLVRQSDGYLAVYNMISRPARKTTKMEAIDLVGTNKAYAEFADTHPVNKGLIPYRLQLKLSGKTSSQDDALQQLSVSIDHSSVTVTDSTLSFPFQVPNNYKKAF